MNVELTKRERECFEHLQSAERLGVSLKEYADAYDVDVQFLYNTKSQLVKKGALPGAKPKPAVENDAECAAEDANNPFVAVRVEEPAASRKPVPVLKMKHKDGHLLEFASWPPAELLAMVLSEARDLAA